jgi:hypothetical protein
MIAKREKERARRERRVSDLLNGVLAAEKKLSAAVDKLTAKA